MKKVLLSGLMFLAAMSSYAQFSTLPDGYYPGSSYAKDYIVKPIALDNIYFWTQLTGPKKVAVDSTSQDLFDLGGGCYKDSLFYTYNWKRVANTGLNYTMTQQYMNYEPVGVGFGFTYKNAQKTDSSANTLDLSGGKAYFHFKLTNTSRYSYTVKVGLQDSTGAIVNAIGTSKDNQVYLDEVTLKLAPSASVDTTINFNVNAYHSLYTYDTCYVGSAAGKDKSFNYSIVTAGMVTVVNDSNAAALDGYKPFTLHNATFTLTNIFIGDIHAANPVGIADNFLAKPSFRIYPNPVSNVNGVLNFEKEVKGVQVVNSVGQVVYSAPSASSLDVNNYQKGIYVIQSTTGNARFVVQ
jgi:hypothetical protein